MTTGHSTTTILNIDDDVSKRYTVTRVLRRSGFQVMEAETAYSGLELVSQSPDLIVLDVRLPDLSGFDVCRRLKSNPDTASIPVLMLSASLTESQDRTTGLEYGADGYITYPVEAHELVATIHALLRLSQAEAHARVVAHEWRSTFNAIPDGICVIDRNGAIVRANDALGLLASLPPAELIGRNMRELIAKAFDIDPDTAIPSPAPSSDRIMHEFTSRERIYQLTLDRIPETGGSVSIFSDITDRRKLEQELAATYEKDRRIADALQGSFLIDIPTGAYPRLNTARFYEPAWEEASVGGDYYDSFSLPSGHIVLVVGDATGKGLAAAARTAEVKYAVRAFAHEHRDPGAVLMRINNFLCEMHQSEADGDVVVALALAIVDPDAESVRFAIAGAEPPLILHPDGNTHSVTGGGLPLGVAAGHQYASLIYDLSEGDTIILVTDGITEARRGRDFLGYEGLVDLAQRHASEYDINRFGQAIVEGARLFTGGKFQDDVCLLAARRTDGHQDHSGRK